MRTKTEMRNVQAEDGSGSVDHRLNVAEKRKAKSCYRSNFHGEKVT